jgi:hypothetical protein
VWPSPARLFSDLGEGQDERVLSYAVSTVKVKPGSLDLPEPETPTREASPGVGPSRAL